MESQSINLFEKQEQVKQDRLRMYMSTWGVGKGPEVEEPSSVRPLVAGVPSTGPSSRNVLPPIPVLGTRALLAEERQLFWPWQRRVEEGHSPRKAGRRTETSESQREPPR